MLWKKSRQEEGDCMGESITFSHRALGWTLLKNWYLNKEFKNLREWAKCKPETRAFWAEYKQQVERACGKTYSEWVEKH